MKAKYAHWDDNTAKREILKRYNAAKEARRMFEDQWAINERAVYDTSGGSSTTLYNRDRYGYSSTPDNSNIQTNNSLIFKNIRFLHAQASANPPSVVMRPATSDADDHRRADAADRVARFSTRQYSLQEKQDQLTLQAMTYGTGAVKTLYDPNIGAPLSYDKETGEMVLEGDLSVTVPFVWNLYLDPDARCMDDLKFVIEKIYIDKSEALAMWPNKKDALQQASVKGSAEMGSLDSSEIEASHHNEVELLEYWETGLPSNGFMGRHCLMTVAGDVIEPCKPSPFRFRWPAAVKEILKRSDLPEDARDNMLSGVPETARLPYLILTDIDVPNTIWGKSAVDYAVPIQDQLDGIDSARMDNIKAHAVARLLLPEGSELVEGDSLNNSAWSVSVVSGAGGQSPYYMGPPQLMPDMSLARRDLIETINNIFGVNESMFGQQSREQAAAAMQFATNQGNMIRRRFFNKYQIVVEQLYRNILQLFARHWTVQKTISVIGKEKALEAIDLQGSDFEHGYDVIAEYGTSLSLDPITRRQEIISLQPLFEKAGLPPRQALKMLKLSEVEGMYDKLALAENRQKEIFDIMSATNSYIPPKKFRDHENMIAWAMDYFMTAEFENLPPEIQVLCERHIEERVQVAAEEKAGPAQAPQAPGSAAPLPGTAAMAEPPPADVPLPPPEGLPL